jgi:hypothetical protein
MSASHPIAAQHLIEIAADFLRGQIGRLELKSGNLGQRRRHQPLLNLAGSFEFRRRARLFAADARKAEEHHNRDRQKKEKIADIGRLDGNRAELE